MARFAEPDDYSEAEVTFAFCTNCGDRIYIGYEVLLYDTHCYCSDDCLKSDLDIVTTVAGK